LKNKPAILACLASALVGCGAVFAQSGIGSEDMDKGGSYWTGLMDGVETFSKTADGINAAENAVGVVGDVKEQIAEVKEVGIIEGLQGTLTSIAVPYTNSKASVILMVENALKKTNDIIGRVANRVDMWRTTKPTIEKYYKAAGRLADDTKKLYNEFTWSKFFDYHRPWDRKREKLFDMDANSTNWRGAYVQYCRDARDYMTELYNNANPEAGEDEKAKRLKRLAARRGHIIPNDWTDKTLPKLIDDNGDLRGSLIPDFENVMVPYNALELSALILYTLDELQSEYKSFVAGDFGDVSREDEMIQRMMKDLNEGETPVDTRNLSQYIAGRRVKIQDQANRANQLRVQAQTYYANLFLRERDMVERAARTVEAELGIIAMGRDNYEYYDTYIRPEIMDSASIRGRE